MFRGEVWWADLPAPAGRRPVVLLSRNKAIEIREYVTVAEVTRTIRDIPTEVPLGPKEGLPVNCVVNLDVINTIPKKTLSGRISFLPVAKLSEVDKAIKFALNIK